MSLFPVYCCYALLLRRWAILWWRLLLGIRNPQSSACDKMVSFPLLNPFWTCNKFQGSRQAHTEVHWTVQDFGEERCWTVQDFGERGEVAYQLELPSQLSDVHNIFHVSQLKKCLWVPGEQILMEDLEAKEDLSYQEYPVKILEMSERVTQNKKIKMCKVQWSHHTEEEAT
jgi:hypothetical protein